MFRRSKARLKMAVDVCNKLDKEYGADMVTYLDHRDAFELLIATILSAQCTDKRVNMVTPALFKKYPTVHDFACADITELEEIIHSVGFYHAKASNIIACAAKLEDEFGGEVPRTIKELTSLPGVGRKTANVIRGNIFNDPSIVVDTHVKRISLRLGLTESDDPVVAEEQLMKVLPKDNWIRYNIQIIRLGRTICTSRAPKCPDCFMNDICPYGQKNMCVKKN